MKFTDYPTAKIVAWLESIEWRMPGRRAWKTFTDWARETYGDFSAMTRSGGLSGSPKLLAAVEVLRRLRESGDLAKVATVGEALELARAGGWALGFLPPVDHAVKVAKLAGRPDVADRLANAGF